MCLTTAPVMFAVSCFVSLSVCVSFVKCKSRKCRKFLTKCTKLYSYVCFKLCKIELRITLYTRCYVGEIISSIQLMFLVCKHLVLLWSTSCDVNGLFTLLLTISVFIGWALRWPTETFHHGARSGTVQSGSVRSRGF